MIHTHSFVYLQKAKQTNLITMYSILPACILLAAAAFCMTSAATIPSTDVDGTNE